MTRVGRPRAVFCIVEHAHRDRTVAEEVARGRFRHQGVALDLGVEPDWLGAALPPDPEWRLEWVKFYYGLDLAWAFRETGDRRFQETWERLVVSWIRRVPMAIDPPDVIGRRIQNWIYAWIGFAGSARYAGLREDAEDAILASLAAQIAHLRDHLTKERNHRTLELYALFIAALALPSLDSGGELLAFATEALRRNLLDDFCRDGVHRERSTHYHHIVLRSFLGARENARRFGVSFGAPFDARLLRACEFSAHIHRPDGTIPALSDSDSGSYTDLLALAADLFDRPEWAAAAAGGAIGAPHRANASFPIGGYFVQRRGDRFLVFDCGPLGDGGHGHYDALSIEVAAPAPVIVDPGRYSYYDGPPHWRRWFKSTAAHNTVSVDGLDQTPYSRGKPKGPVARARFVQRSGGSDLDILYGEVSSPAYDATHRRRILFVAGDYWIVHDSIAAPAPHRYDVRFHLASPADVERQPHAPQDGRGIRAGGVALVIAGDWPISVEDGWVSESYGIKRAAPIVVATASDVERADFFSLVAPTTDASPMPTFEIARRSVAGEEMIVADVQRTSTLGARHDVVAWTTSGRPALPDAGIAEAFAVIDADGPDCRLVLTAPVDVYAGLDVDRAASAVGVGS